MKHTIRLTTTAMFLVAGMLLGLSEGQAADKKKKNAESGKWRTLFDGKLHGKLRGYKTEGFPENAWKIDGDALSTIHKDKGGEREDLVTTVKFKNFELRWEWRSTEGGNSGVMYGVQIGEKPAYFTGPEYQMLDDDGHPDGKIVLRRTACLYDLVEAKGKTLKPIGEWNTSRIVSKDEHYEHWLNGTKVLEYVWGSDEIKALVKESKFAEWPDFMTMRSGYIAFQHHGQEFSIRNLKILRL